MQLELKDIMKSFESKHVLKDVNFTFEKGKIYGLLGRNGAGKTTLFNCLSGEINQDEGSAVLTIDDCESELSNDHIGYVFSTPILPEFLTGYEFVKFFMDINKSSINEGKAIEDYFNMVKIQQEDRHKLIKGYSHGMKNKLQMLCVIIARPPVILLDEPLTSLDVVVALEIKKMLKELKHEHIIIFSTHILKLATDLCDEIVVLSDGRLEQIEHEMLKSSEFEEKVVELLRDDEND